MLRNYQDKNLFPFEIKYIYKSCRKFYNQLGSIYI